MYRKLYSTLVIMAHVFITGPAFAQIALENEYAYSATISTSMGDDFFYYLLDGDLNECRIYTATHQLYKTIPLAATVNYYPFDVRYVSTQLFDPDPLLELLYLTYQYVSDTTGIGYYQYELRVINEEGKILLQVPGAGYAEIISPDSETRKLLCYVYDYSRYPYTVHTQVYKLENKAENEKKEALSTAMLDDPAPNPAQNFIRINYNTGDETVPTYLKLSDMTGRMVDSRNLQPGKGSFFLPVSIHAPGMYLLMLQRGQALPETKRIVIE